MQAAGWTLVNADCVLIGEEPRIAAHRDEMRRRLAAAVGGGEVAVRATTTDRLGFTGRGEGLAAQAVALLAAHDRARPLRRSARSARDPLRDAVARTFPEFMHHNRPARATGAGSYPSIRTSSSRCVDGDELVAELHSLPLAWDGTLGDLPPGWDDGFTRAFESGRPRDASPRSRSRCCPSARASGSSTRMLDAMREVGRARRAARPDRAGAPDARRTATR